MELLSKETESGEREKGRKGGEDIRSKGIRTSMEEAEEEESKLMTNVNELETNRHADARR